MTNAEFERKLRYAAEEHLKPEIDADNFVKITLDELWTDDTYMTGDGTEHYFEIAGRYTTTGNPVVVS